MIHLNLTTDEVNTILSLLGKAPYENVYTLIHKLQHQATKQLQDKEEVEEIPEQRS